MKDFVRLLNYVSTLSIFLLSFLAFSVSANAVAPQYRQKPSVSSTNIESPIQDDALKDSSIESRAITKVTASDHGEASIPPSKGKNEKGTVIFYAVQFGTLPKLTLQEVDSAKIEILNQEIDHFTVKNNSSARLQLKWKAETIAPSEPHLLERRNLALRQMGHEFPKVSASFTFAADSPVEAVDGIVNFDSEPSNRWTCHTSPNSTDWFEIDFGEKSWPETVELAFFDDGRGVKIPAKYSLEYWDGQSWQLATTKDRTEDKEFMDRKIIVVDLINVATQKFRLSMTHQPKARSGLTEIRVWGIGQMATNSASYALTHDVAEKKIIGEWRHVAGNSDAAIIRLFGSGAINDEQSDADRWSINGDNLLLNWKRADAPKGYWLDDCRLVANNLLYIGKNQRGVSIHGTRLSEDGERLIKADKIVGGIGGLAFGDIADEGWFLTGLKIATEKFRNQRSIATIVPVYGNLKGDTRVGATIGGRKQSLAPVGCKPGFRVASIEVYHDQFIRGIKLQLVNIDKPDKTVLTSLWGTDDLGEKVVLGNSRAEIVGICGRFGSVIDALGIIELDQK